MNISLCPKIGLFSRFAFSNASSPHKYQSVGLYVCCNWYGFCSLTNLVTFFSLNKRINSVYGKFIVVSSCVRAYQSSLCSINLLKPYTATYTHVFFLHILELERKFRSFFFQVPLYLFVKVL